MTHRIYKMSFASVYPHYVAKADTLGVEPGETTADGKFTLIELECLGSCGTAPAVLVNDVLHEDVTVETIDQLIARLPADAHQYKDPTVNWRDDSHAADAPGSPGRH